MIILEFLYPLFISFILVFISELGDKTQLIALSFSSKLKFYVIILGVALGSFFSHGIAILFGSFLGNIDNQAFQSILKIITYISFIIFGKLLSKKIPDNIISLCSGLLFLIFGFVGFVNFIL